MLLEPVILKCPHCGKESSHYDMMSYTISGTEQYSDGKVIQLDHSGLPIFTPSFYKCANCGFLYEHYNAILKEGASTTNQPNELLIEEENPGIDDLIQGLNQPWDTKIEISLRLHIWWGINDLIRYPELHHNPIFRQINKIKQRLKMGEGWQRFRAYNKVFKANLNSLIGLVHHEPEFILLQAEMYRELAEYSKAMETIQQVPSTYKKQAKAIKPLIRKKRWKVAKI